MGVINFFFNETIGVYRFGVPSSLGFHRSINLGFGIIRLSDNLEDDEVCKTYVSPP